MKRFGTFAMVALLVFCATTLTAQKKGGYKVAVSILNASNTLYVDIIKGVKSAYGPNDTVTIVDCQDNAAKQASQIESLANAGYEGIIMLPADSAAVSPAASAAMKKGTRILTYVTRLKAQSSHINSNPYVYGGMLGKYVGQWVKDHWPNEEVVEVGMLTYNSIPEVITRQQGMVQEMQKIAPNAKVVAEKDAGSQADGMNAAENFLQAHPSMKVIMGINDGGAVGAYQAVIASGKATADYFVGGTDGIKEALELIAKPNSIYRCTVSINPFDIGKQCALNLKNMVDGKKFWTEGSYNLQLVTPENIKDFFPK
jgi:ribose transport system substrate-binding protein